jgi:hypothetical protein
MKISKRPNTLFEIAERSHSKETFGYELADFEHEIARATSRRELSEAIQQEPPPLAERFVEGAIADTWLAALAELLAARYALKYPEWIWNANRFLREPLIHDGHSKKLKVWHILKSVPAFSRRNYFVDYQLPVIQLRRGRPRLSDAHKREMNRKRVARHRAQLHPLPNVVSELVGRS